MTIAPPSPSSGIISTSKAHADPSAYDGRARHVSTHAWVGLGDQWGAIAAGAIAGLAIAVLMATLGVALGLTASAVAVPDANMSGVSMNDAQNVAVGFGIGAGVWILITAAAVGLAGGAVLAKMAQWDRPYSPWLLSIVTWGLGIGFATLLASSGAAGLTTALGAGSVGATAAAADNAMRPFQLPNAGDSAAVPERGANGQPITDGPERAVRTWTPEQRAAAIKAAEVATAAAATAAWFALVAQLIALGATVLTASSEKFRSAQTKLVLPQV
ncbi:MAG: hypothetical protein JNM84_05455 [Planctomycetes bacterium]|nr:hypothetical protein [Planctomycetota bacterium]